MIGALVACMIVQALSHLSQQLNVPCSLSIIRRIFIIDIESIQPIILEQLY